MLLLTAIVICILIAIFRRDGEGAYDRSEKPSGRYLPAGKDPAAQNASARPAARPASPKATTPGSGSPLRPASVHSGPSTTMAPRDKTAFRSTESISLNDAVQDRPLEWSFLYYLDYDESLPGEMMETQIAGLRHHCTVDDVGIVNGTVRPEPDNLNDPRAQVVIRADGKKLGYIPSSELDEYEEIAADGLECPFSGEITIDRLGNMSADIMVVQPQSRDFVKQTLSEYVDDMLLLKFGVGKK